MSISRLDVKENQGISIEGVIARIENNILYLKTSALFLSVCKCLESIDKLKSFQSIICLGVGNFSHSSSSLLQFAMFICLRERFLCDSSIRKNSTVKLCESFIFDPILTEMEKTVCLRYKLSICEKNLFGQYLIPNQTENDFGNVLFFLPHCPYQLYCNILWTNVKFLDRIYIIGNRFDTSIISKFNFD